MNQTMFYVLGICLVLSALGITALGLRNPRFPTQALMGAILLVVALIVAGTMTFAVRFAGEEQKSRNAKLAAEASAAQPTVPGPGGTLALSASATRLAFDKTTLQSRPGRVTINFTNPSQTQHDVAIQKGAQTVAVSNLISQSSTSVSAELAPGTYTYFCSVPGHEQAGMKGTLTVK